MSDINSLPNDALARVVAGLNQYNREVSSNYDELLIEVTDRASESGSLGKTDIGALLFWKRLRADTPWARKLLGLSDGEVRDITGQMVAAARDNAVPTPEAAGNARSALSSLPGFRSGDALASALILAAAPKRMAIYDRRAQAALDSMSISLTSAPGRYRRYMAIVENLAQAVTESSEQQWTARDVDCALYIIGGNR